MVGPTTCPLFRGSTVYYYWTCKILFQSVELIIISKLIDKKILIHNYDHNYVHLSYYSDHVRNVYTSDNGLLSAISPGTLMIDSSTIDPSVSQEMYKLAKEKGSQYIDAPVSGGTVTIVYCLC